MEKLNRLKPQERKINRAIFLATLFTWKDLEKTKIWYARAIQLHIDSPVYFA
jgi:hypothetical protein